MICENCIYYPKTLNGPCMECRNESMLTKQAQKPERKPSRWERRWIRWAKKEARKRERETGKAPET